MEHHQPGPQTTQNITDLDRSQDQKQHRTSSAWITNPSPAFSPEKGHADLPLRRVILELNQEVEEDGKNPVESRHREGHHVLDQKLLEGTPAGEVRSRDQLERKERPSFVSSGTFTHTRSRKHSPRTRTRTHLD